jgi:hypothetical protein
MNAQTKLHLVGRDGEERRRLPRNRATAERDAERARHRVGVTPHRLDRIEIVATPCRRAEDFEDEEVTRDAAPRVEIGGRRHVIRDKHLTHVDAFHLQAHLRHPEVHHVATVVAIRKDHASTAIQRLADAVALLARRAGENVADHRTMRKALADQPAKERIMPAAAPYDYRDFARRRTTLDHYARRVRHTFHIAAVGGGEAVNHLFFEVNRVIEDFCHLGCLTLNEALYQECHRARS